MTSACQVDFYVLQDPSQSAEQQTCSLALMAWEQGHRIMVLAPDQAQAQRLDELMWDYPRDRFLPHAQKQQPVPAPVMIGVMADLDDDAGEAIINLTQHAVPQPERFRRVLELVPANDAQRQASRVKFREYRGRGLEPASHPVNTSK